MSPTYQQNKKYMITYKEINPKKYYEIRSGINRRYKTWKKIQKEFLNILIQEIV